MYEPNLIHTERFLIPWLLQRISVLNRLNQGFYLCILPVAKSLVEMSAKLLAEAGCMYNVFMAIRDSIFAYF